MTSPDTDEEFYLSRAIKDSRGNKIIPPDALARGSLSAVVGNIIDSQERKACEAVLNDAAVALGTLETIRAREDAVKRREDAVNTKRRAQLLHDFSRKLDAIADRIDSLESERAAAAHDPDDDLLPSPPLPTGNDGELESPKTAPAEALMSRVAGDDGELEAPVQVPEIEKYQDPDQPRNPVAAEDA